jgi:hypothetical protein
LVAGAADIGMTGEKKKPIRDGINEAVGNIEARQRQEFPRVCAQVRAGCT